MLLFRVLGTLCRHSMRKITVIVELCACLLHTVEPSSTLVNDQSHCSGNQSVCDRRLIGRAVIVITKRTGSS